MSLFGAIIDRTRGLFAGRNWRWYRRSKEHLRYHPDCVFCDRKATVVHHIYPVAYFPDREMSDGWWASCCAKCHLYVAHGGNWSNYLPAPQFWIVAEAIRVNTVRKR